MMTGVSTIFHNFVYISLKVELLKRAARRRRKVVAAPRSDPRRLSRSALKTNRSEINYFCCLHVCTNVIRINFCSHENTRVQSSGREIGENNECDYSRLIL